MKATSTGTSFGPSSPTGECPCLEKAWLTRFRFTDHRKPLNS